MENLVRSTNFIYDSISVYSSQNTKTADFTTEGMEFRTMAPVLQSVSLIKVARMLLPKEPVRYEKPAHGLRDFQAMLGEFKLEGFSGYVLLDFPSAKFVVLLEKGDSVRVVDLSGEKELCTHIEAVRLHLEDAPGYAIVVELPWFCVDQMVRILLCDRLYENLLTDFVNFQKLLDTLEKKRHTGTMELQIGNRVHFLIFRFGIPQFSVLQYSTALKTEPPEELVTMVEKKGALINFYVPRDISFVNIFEMLGSGLLDKYSELNGKRLADYMGDELNTFLEQFEDIEIADGCYCISRVPDDFREQEKIFKEILHHQIELFNHSVGRRTTYRVYNHLLESVREDVREIFREVIL